MRSKEKNRNSEEILFDSFLRDELKKIAEEVNGKEEFQFDMTRLNTIDKEEKGMKKRRSVKYITVFAVLVCVLSLTAFGLGKRAGYIGHSTLKGNTFPSEEKMTEYLGSLPNVSKEFSNGYKFVNYSQGENSIVLDDGEKLETVKNVMFGYEKKGGRGKEISLMVSQKFETQSEEDEKGIEHIMIEQMPAVLYEMDYKIVPPSYQLTEEDKEKMESGVLEISYGSKEVEEEHSTIVSWEEGDLDYSLIYSGQYEVTANDLIDMVKEMIAQ